MNEKLVYRLSEANSLDRVAVEHLLQMHGEDAVLSICHEKCTVMMKVSRLLYALTSGEQKHHLRPRVSCGVRQHVW